MTRREENEERTNQCTHRKVQEKKVCKMYVTRGSMKLEKFATSISIGEQVSHVILKRQQGKKEERQLR